MKRQKSFSDISRASLYLVATPIGNLSEFSSRAIETLKTVDYIACEDTRNSKKLLSHFDIHSKLMSYHNFNEKESTKGIIDLILDGNNVAIISDAGYPLVSDPGYEVVNEAIRRDIPVVAINGPSAALSALVVSGLDTKHYLFYGFLNAKSSSMRKELESLANFPYTIIFYEAPHRINKTLELILDVFGNREAVIARELTKVHEEIIRGDLLSLSTIEDIKGEIVLLVEGKKDDEVIIDYNILVDKINDKIKEGIKAKQAINDIAKDYNISKNELYNYYHQHQNN